MFTLEEPGGDGSFQLHPHGRHSHAEAYARAALSGAGLTVLEVRRDVLRTELNAPVAGLVIAARR